MFLLVMIGVPVLEVLAFIEVGRAIGWIFALLLLVVSSLVGVRVLRIQGRATIDRVTLAVSERRAPGRAALDGALGFLGGVLLVVPGFITDALGLLLLLPPVRAIASRWISHRYAGRVMSFAAAAGRFAPGARAARPPDVDSTAFEDELDQLDR